MRHLAAAAQIVFDAYNTDSGSTTTSRVSPSMETVFTCKDQTADQYIERQTQALKQAGCPSVMVVSCLLPDRYVDGRENVITEYILALAHCITLQKRV